jgi:hypothetical protein
MQSCVNLEFLNGIAVERIEEKIVDSFRTDSENSNDQMNDISPSPHNIEINNTNEINEIPEVENDFSSNNPYD